MDKEMKRAERGEIATEKITIHLREERATGAAEMALA